MAGYSAPVRTSAARVRGEETVAGELAVDGTRISFTPRGFYQKHHYEPWSADAKDVQAVRVAPRQWTFAGGAIRKRLEIELTTGATELFVVWRPARCVAEIRTALDHVAVLPPGAAPNEP